MICLLGDGFEATPQRFLWHEATATAVLSDVHLGAEAELRRRGIFMPDVSGAAIRAAWRLLCERLRAAGNSRLIIAGDLFDVPTPDGPAVAMAVELLRALPAGCSVTLIPGNHDPAVETLGRMFEGLPVEFADSAAVGGYSVIHGHVSQHAGDRAGGLIVGHQHPAVMIRNRVQSAKMICFGVCSVKRNGARVPLILLPAFSRAPLGSTLSAHHWIVDLPCPADEDIRVLGIIEGDRPQVLDFGTLASLRLPF
jgi:putative SbcD/Mre11-related phosphoesterase